jgi:leucine-rich repeat transmembrane neuronal protein 1/2
MVDEKIPVSIWSGVLKLGYVGCIRELILNDEPVDVVRYTEEQDLGEVEISKKYTRKKS